MAGWVSMSLAIVISLLLGGYLIYKFLEWIFVIEPLNKKDRPPIRTTSVLIVAIGILLLAFLLINQ